MDFIQNFSILSTLIAGKLIKCHLLVRLQNSESEDISGVYQQTFVIIHTYLSFMGQKLSVNDIEQIFKDEFHPTTAVCATTSSTSNCEYDYPVKTSTVFCWVSNITFAICWQGNFPVQFGCTNSSKSFTRIA